MAYALKTFVSTNDLLKTFPFKLSSYHWEATEPYRPDTYANIGVINGELVASMKCYETEPKSDCSNLNDPIYTDSCLEFFVAPVADKAEYINVECNSKGVFLSEFGDGKYNRKLVSDISEVLPVVEPFSDEDEGGSFWGVVIRIPSALVADLYNIKENEFNYNVVKLNFYKCGDDCEVEHYLAFSPVTTLPPGFHNPTCFATFLREK